MKLTKSGLPEALQAWRDSFIMYKIFEYVWNITIMYKIDTIDLLFRRVMVIIKIWINKSAAMCRNSSTKFHQFGEKSMHGAHPRLRLKAETSETSTQRSIVICKKNRKKMIFGWFWGDLWKKRYAASFGLNVT